MKDEFIMKDNYDFSKAKKNPYASMITPEQRIQMMIKIAFEKSGMTKEDFKKEVDAILT